MGRVGDCLTGTSCSPRFRFLRGEDRAGQRARRLAGTGCMGGKGSFGGCRLG